MNLHKSIRKELNSAFVFDADKDAATDAIVELIKGAVPTKRSDNLGMKE